MTYAEIKTQIEGLKDNDAKKNKFLFVKERFRIQYGEQVDYFLESFLDIQPEDDKESIYKKLCKDFNINKFFQDNFQDEICSKVNEYWKAKGNATDLIDTISNYKINSILNGNQEKILNSLVHNINDDPSRYIDEIIQNADDCGAKNFMLELCDDEKISISYEEPGMSCFDVFAISLIGETGKKNRTKRLIGEKGVGFKTIFASCKAVDIYSGGYCFRQEDENSILTIKQIEEPKIQYDENSPKTWLILELKDNFKAEELYKALKVKYGLPIEGIDLSKEQAFKNCPILFTNSLNSIEVKYTNASFKISISDTLYNDCTTIEYEGDVQANIECFKQSYPFELDWVAYNQRYPNQFSDEDEFNSAPKNIKNYPIEIVAPIHPIDDNIVSGRFYSFLPTSTDIYAPLAIQLPVKLNLNRSSMFFSNDTDTTGEKIDCGNLPTLKWNCDLMTALKGAEGVEGAEGAITKFYTFLKSKTNSMVENSIFDYLPNYNNDNNLFSNAKMNENFSGGLFDVFKVFPYYNEQKSSDVIVYDEFISENFGEEFHKKYQESSNKVFVKYNDRIFSKLETLKKFGLTYCSEPLTPNNSKIINELLDDDSLRVKILNFYKKDEDGKINLPSKFLPKKPNTLEIFPVRRQETIQYISYSNHIWFFCEDKELYSYNYICFSTLDLTSYAILDINNSDNCESIPNPSDDIFKVYSKFERKLSGEKVSSKLIIELMTFLSKHLNKSNLGWYDYTKNILEKKLDDAENTYWEDSIKNLANFTSKMVIDIDDEEYIKLHALGVIGHGIVNNKELTYTLPSRDKWTEEFCNVLNSLEYKSSIKFELENQDVGQNNDNYKSSFFQKVKGIPEVIKVILCDNLKVSFVRYAGTVILKEEEGGVKQETITDCKNSMRKGLGIFDDYKYELKKFIGNTNEPNKDKLDILTKMSILQIYFKIDNVPIRNNLEFDVLNELLQNANDKVCFNDNNVNIQLDDAELTLNYKETSGFLMKDFLAVSTIGNSGNKDDEKRTSSTGYKGTGFKGVYKLFDKVVIKSNGIICELDYTQTFESIKFKDKDFKILGFKDKEEEDQDHYPIPIFSEYEDSSDKKLTTITLTFRNTNPNPDTLKSIENFKESIKKFKEGKKYYFLDNINSFKIDGEEFNREEYMNNFHIFTNKSYVDNINELIKTEERFKNIDNIPKEHCIITTIFPKAVPKEDVSRNLYVGLPVNGNSDFSGKFYINAPFLKLTDNRLNLFECDKLKEYVCLAVKESIEQIVGREDLACLAYRYFPYNQIENNENGWNSNLIKSIKFIRTVKSTDAEEKDAQYISINELKDVDLLPKYVYQVVSKSYHYAQDKPFIYYVDNYFYDIISKALNIETPKDLTPFYKWALGESCDTNVYTDALGIENEFIEFIEFKHINGFIKKINAHFEDTNFVETDFNYSYYNECFKNKRESVYYFQNKLVSKNDEILLYLKKYNQLELLYKSFKYIDTADVSNLNDLIKDELIVVKTTNNKLMFLQKEMYWTEVEDHWLKSDDVFLAIGSYKILQKPDNKLDKPHDWNSDFFKYLKYYNAYLAENNYKIPEYSFNFKNIGSLKIDILEKCESDIPTEYLNTEYLNGKKMINILKEDVVIYNSSFGGSHNWTLGYCGDEIKIVVFQERSIPKLIKEFFGYEGFSLTKSFAKMNCVYPIDDYDLDWDSFESLKNFTGKDYEYKKYITLSKDGLKKVLTDFCFFEDEETAYYFKGYGEENICPICKAKLIAGMNQLQVRSVKLTENIFIPILCCINCVKAFAHTIKVYFCDEKTEFYDNKTILTKINASGSDFIIKLCFEMSDYSKVCFDINILPLHRKLMILELTKQTQPILDSDIVDKDDIL